MATVSISSDSATISSVNMTQQAVNPASPAANHWRSFFKSDGPYIKSSSGVVTKIVLPTDVPPIVAASWPRFVPLTTPLTSTAWDGDAHSTHAAAVLDLSVVFGAPAGIKAVLIYLGCNDSGSAAGAAYFNIGPGSGKIAEGLILDGVPNDKFRSHLVTCPCDANGDIWWECDASGVNTLDVELVIWGYWV